MKKVLIAFAVLVVAVIAAVWLRAPSGDRATQAVTGLPWQIEILPDGNSKVFGLTLGVSTIGDARQRFGPDMEIAVVAASDEAGAVEAYYGKVTTGVVSGKVILTAALDQASVDGMRQRAPRKEFMESSTRKYELAPGDLALAYAAPIAGITFIPSASLDEKVALSLFGQPDKRIRVSEKAEHLLYPNKGLALTLDDAGKEVLQYVAPKAFSRLQDALTTQKVKSMD